VDAAVLAGRHVLVLNWRDTRHPEGGGSELFIERISAELAGYGHRVTILCAHYAGAARVEPGPPGVTFLRRGGRLSVFIWAAMLYLAGGIGLGPLGRRRLGRPDVIIDVGNGLPFLSILYARVPVIALVHHVHREQWPMVMDRVRAKVGWWVESRVGPWAYRRCRYVTVSEATRADLGALGVRLHQITVIHNGTPEVTDAPIPRDPNPNLVVLGRLVAHKRIEIALRATAALASEFPELTLTVAGQGWWEPQLRQLTDELGITDRVRFAGFVDESDKHRILSRAWVALTPSLKEGWGLTIVEAGARGTPTVAFAGAGGVAEALVDGESGLIAADEDHFIDLTAELLRDHARRDAMGNAALKHALSFTWEQAGESFAALIVTAKSPAVARRAHRRGRPGLDQTPR
jgi:glycosyltransferase involved in cell wall biosynthesis